MDREEIDMLINDFQPPENADDNEKIIYSFARYNSGRIIRNRYGLWDKNNPYVILDPKPNVNGIIDHPLFPDNYSGEILEKFITKLKEQQHGRH